MILRLLTPDKKGIQKRISESVERAGGKVKETHVKREMRGMSESEVVVSFSHEAMRPEILQSLGRIPGVALIGSNEST